MYMINGIIDNIDIVGQHLSKQHCLIDVIDAFWLLPCCNPRPLFENPFVDTFYVDGFTFAAHCPPYNVVMHIETVQPA